EATPADLVSIASDVGCQQVCIFTHIPVAALPDHQRVRTAFPLVTRPMERQMLQRLRERGISVGNIEFFPVTADVPIENYREGLALGSGLGAQRAVTHIHDPSDVRA